MFSKHLSKMLILFAICFVGACVHTKPGTYVELVDRDGGDLYVAGAAAPGISRSIACRAAVRRAAAAVAHRFAQEESGMSDDVAEAVVASDGVPLLYAFANDRVLSAPVQDTTFDPTNHLCMATVRWKPPIFLLEAVTDYAKKVKRQELGAEPAMGNQPKEGDEVSVEPEFEAKPEVDGSGGVSVSSTSSKGVRLKKQVCSRERAKARLSADTLQNEEDSLDECHRRTSGSEKACYGYKLRSEQAQAMDKSARRRLRRCLGTSKS